MLQVIKQHGNNQYDTTSSWEGLTADLPDPNTEIPNASKFYDYEKGHVYVFDLENLRWINQNTLS